ncbi:pseudouridine synthase [Mycena sp. CBHHK59/15]|nr:pseudouridine synthase [Mycena sp. CBHHK59/15]
MGYADLPEVARVDLKLGLKLRNAPYRVHRLDKGTTGCFVLARSSNIARELSLQFKTRTVHKTYLALVRGGSKSFPEKTGQIRTPLKYTGGRASIMQDGFEQESQGSEPKESRTDWEVVASSSRLPLTLLRLNLLTGHKHQLRVHLAQVLKTPILGDTLYSLNQPAEAISEVLELPDDRIFLHASQISFFRYRPTGGNKQFRIRMIAPLPSDFAQICSEAGIPVNEYERSGGLFMSGRGSERHVENGEIPDVNGYWIPQQK